MQLRSAVTGNRVRRVAGRLFRDRRTRLSYAMLSFSPPELSDLLCGTTEIRHVFS